MALSFKLLCAFLVSLRLLDAKPIIGTNIGGWMVLEPWITPSLFYRFLEQKPGDFAADSYYFCEALGAKKANAILRQHWDDFYKEQDIKDLSERGVEMVRLPIGDWTLNQYGPYVGCMDGAAEKIDWMFDVCAKYNITILLDVHAMKDSQNGFDNSGQTKDLVWYDDLHFSHWPTGQANW
jgi:glucan 1,3-beta-glucosidase